LLPSDEILGVTVIIVSASYRDKEFVRVGYYVNTYYDDEELNAQVEKDLEEKQASTRPIVWEKLMRNVLIEKPKVTR
jgi:histone chaperone ASF1